MLLLDKVVILFVLSALNLSLLSKANEDEILEEDDNEFESPDNKLDLIKLFAGRYYQNTYKQINEYLMNHLKSRDAEENMKLALEWLEDERKRPTLFNRHFTEGLSQFTALAKTKRRCDRISYSILVKNDRATNYIARNPFEAENSRRIDNIVRHYALDHAKYCKSVYPEKYRQKMALLDKSRIEDVEQKLKGIVNTISDTKILEVLLNLARDDPDRKYLRKVLDEKTRGLTVNKSMIEKLVERYFDHMRPSCEYLVRNLGDEIFVPSQYDVKMFLPEDRYKDLEFLLATKRFTICKNLVKPREVLVNNLIEAASKY